MSEGPQIRVLGSESEMLAAEQVFRTAMVGLPSPRTYEAGQMTALREPGRVFGAYLPEATGGEQVLAGAADATSSTMTVPGGGGVGHAGVTHVGVLPTHTRRGVLRALMRRQLADARDRGQPVASLRASEGGIYERFGYGVATRARAVRLDLRSARLRGDEPGLPVRMVPMEDSWDLLRAVADRNPMRRAGAITRNAQWWAGTRSRGVTAPRYCVVAGEAGAEQGFVCYRPLRTDGWFTSDERTVVVEDMHAATAEVYRALVAFLAGLDLVHFVEFPLLPEDDVLPWMLIDRRAARVTGEFDETWLRLIDVPAALAARTYGAGRPVVLEVEDAFLPENSGRYRVARDGAVRLPDTEAGDDAVATVRVEDLAAVYLGAPVWRQLAASGRVRVHADDVPGAVANLDALFRTEAAPFGGVGF